jgi:hypothetical protein
MSFTATSVLQSFVGSECAGHRRISDRPPSAGSIFGSRRQSRIRKGRQQFRLGLPPSGARTDIQERKRRPNQPVRYCHEDARQLRREITRGPVPPAQQRSSTVRWRNFPRTEARAAWSDCTASRLMEVVASSSPVWSIGPKTGAAVPTWRAATRGNHETDTSRASSGPQTCRSNCC